MEITRRLACRRCQLRKIRCNRKEPCSRCIQGGHSCEYRDNDARKRPVSHKYLSALEARLAYLESLIQQLKDAPHEQRESILSQVDLDDHLAVDRRSDIEPDLALSAATGTSQTHSLRSGPGGTQQFHGPTSIYLSPEAARSPIDENPLPELGRQQSATPSLQGFAILRLASALGVNDALIRNTLPLFFLHQYPFCMFVYREAFLADYYENTYGGRYWSYPLVYAMCTLGAPHSELEDVRAKSTLLAKCAQEVIMAHCLTRPCPTTIQALLCLGFHEIAQGNASQGWLFSGMAFRMGQDIGFHQDPSQWLMLDNGIVCPEDIHIRRRIYWGSYLSDKLLSLYLGRPVYLREDDATVQTTEPLPDFSTDHRWFDLSEIASSEDLQRPQLTVALKHMVLLGKIFQDMMADIFSVVRNASRSETYRLDRLGDLNLRLHRWHASLPESLRWSQWGTGDVRHAHVLALHLYYHAMLLSLNRHFVRPSTGFPQSASSREVCISSVESVAILVRQHRTQYGLHTAPLVLIYSLVMAVITRLHINGPEGLASLGKSLSECAQYYKVAAEALSRLSTFLTPRIIEQHPSAGQTSRATCGDSHRTHSDAGASSTAMGDSTSESWNGVSLGLPLEMDLLDFNAPSDFNDSFNSWFSLGQMG